eukprot:CAMPEP_0119041330 /NCGR_PEP_ID=MMETSP1177-20130426/11558_1 /TAXON_ID=2985 /ORGANISM="Ochromonas sp, Strain CCMP1899" /LENGTH=245 /DNA_ID=CAMNT_0007007293 /DNA_START=33 /DNA_END=766 /DNA_ORIENTATION=-
MNTVTRGCIAEILNGNVVERPTFQILQVRALPQANRHKLTLTDGVSTIVGMLATQMNDKVESGEIKELSIIWVKEFITNDLNGAKILVILDLEITTYLSANIPGTPSLNQDGGFASQNNGNQNNGNQNNGNQNNGNQYNQQQGPPAYGGQGGNVGQGNNQGYQGQGSPPKTGGVYGNNQHTPQNNPPSYGQNQQNQGQGNQNNQQGGGPGNQQQQPYGQQGNQNQGSGYGQQGGGNSQGGNVGQG